MHRINNVYLVLLGLKSCNLARTDIVKCLNSLKIECGSFRLSLTDRTYEVVILEEAMSTSITINGRMIVYGFLTESRISEGKIYDFLPPPLSPTFIFLADFQGPLQCFYR